MTSSGHPLEQRYIDHCIDTLKWCVKTCIYITDVAFGQGIVYDLLKKWIEESDPQPEPCYQCPICLAERIEVSNKCGHCYCRSCVYFMDFCAFCRETIEDIIIIHPNSTCTICKKEDVTKALVDRGIVCCEKCYNKSFSGIKYRRIYL